MKFCKGKALQSKAHELIPGGCHTYAKGDDQFPENSPPFIARGHGCHAWDVDGNEFIEYGMGLRSVTLGHAYPSVVEAAHQQMILGNNFTRPSPLEVQYAEALLAVIPGAEQVKFAKDGSTVTTAAVKLARSFTGRESVALCSDHPFFSYNDWFIGTTAINSGIPEWATAKSLGFQYNNPESLELLFQHNPGDIACVILEPEKDRPPANGFLQNVREICTRHGAILIFDEMITGFRWNIGGAQVMYDIEPDLSTFGKAMANGFALSALVGKREIMDLGGINHDRERVFLLSTTHGAENHALAAGLATLEVYQNEDVIGHLNAQGLVLKVEIDSIISDLGIGDYFKLSGRPCCLAFSTADTTTEPSQLFRTLILQELIRHGIIAPSLVISYSHSEADVARTIDAFRAALVVYKKALESGIERFLIGESVKPVYRKFN